MKLIFQNETPVIHEEYFILIILNSSNQKKFGFHFET